MFAPQSELATKEMIKKRGGKIGFAPWPSKFAIESLFRTNAKNLSKKNPQDPPSPILCGLTEMIEKHMKDVSNIYFDSGTTIHTILSPNHFLEHISKKYGL